MMNKRIIEIAETILEELTVLEKLAIHRGICYFLYPSGKAGSEKVKEFKENMKRLFIANIENFHPKSLPLSFVNGNFEKLDCNVYFFQLNALGYRARIKLLKIIIENEKTKGN